ncbi:MAG: hypothetical protein JWP06_329 [Candidatus Saccharibacteria bacterium]|nr:hypothetical protein [Candidatus Saccharibacteria bacterium]
MNIIVGTKNKAKIAIVTQVMAEFIPSDEMTVTGIDTPSGVPDTPRGEQIKQGAYNRAQNVATIKLAEYGIGIESGLVERYGVWFEEAWACIIIDGKSYYGYSSGLPIPEYVLQTMQKEDLEHGPAMRQILTELSRPDERDTWGTYSDKLILRSVSLQEALRNALIQTIVSKHSLYKIIGKL